MGKKKHGTAVDAPAGAVGRDSSYSISVRGIENGYIVSECRQSGGNYTHTERFSSTKPEIDAPREPSTGPGSETLRAAVKSLK